MATGYDIHGLPFSALPIFSQYSPRPQSESEKLLAAATLYPAPPGYPYVDMGFEHELEDGLRHFQSAIAHPCLVI